MGMMDHWHPMCLSSSLKRRRVLGVQLCGCHIALFRTSAGQVGALDDQCPHRRMKLSKGTVVNDRLQCRYHGWTFNCEGAGESPGTPKLHACAGNYEVREEYGIIWMKPRDAQAKMPVLDIEGFFRMAEMEHVAPAPFEVAVDNFCEIEHTGTIHAIFGYQLAKLNEVQVRVESTDSTVRVVNVGPPKSMGWFINLLLGVKKNYVFTDDWTTYFSPVYSVYEHFSSDPETGKEARVRWRLFMFFTPVDDHHTRVTTLAYAKSKFFGPNGCLKPFRGLMRRKLQHEIDLDVETLANLANYDSSMEGMKLSRFDKALGLNRERINRIYRGIKAEKVESDLRSSELVETES